MAEEALKRSVALASKDEEKVSSSFSQVIISANFCFSR